MKSTQLEIFIKAPRERVYEALTDPQSIQIWRVPDGMHCQIHSFDARVGGKFRISLTYDMPTEMGKTSSQTDTYHGYFKELIPNEKVVEVMEFESENPQMQGEMTSVITLTAQEKGTLLKARHENLPEALSEKDNEEGWNLSLEKLKKLLE